MEQKKEQPIVLEVSQLPDAPLYRVAIAECQLLRKVSEFREQLDLVEELLDLDAGAAQLRQSLDVLLTTARATDSKKDKVRAAREALDGIATRRRQDIAGREARGERTTNLEPHEAKREQRSVETVLVAVRSLLELGRDAELPDPRTRVIETVVPQLVVEHMSHDEKAKRILSILVAAGWETARRETLDEIKLRLGGEK